MAEAMTSKEDAATMKHRIDGLVDELERQGFGRGLIGACMAGTGLALTQVHCGHDEAARIVTTLTNILQSDARQKQ